MAQFTDITHTHDYLLNKCDKINDSFNELKGMYSRMDSTITRMTSNLDKMDEFVTRFNNRNQENRPSCIPGFYKCSKYTPEPPTAPSPKAIYVAGTAHNAVRAIRSNHYR